MNTLSLNSSLIVTLDAITNSSGSTKRSAFATHLPKVTQELIMAVANNMTIARSASLTEKVAFLGKHLKNEQFNAVRSLVDAGIIVVDSLNEKGCDALLANCGALSLDELSENDALFMSYSWDTTSVARVNSTLAETLKGRGIQASGGIVKCESKLVLYVTPEHNLLDLKDRVAQAIMTTCTYAHADYQDILDSVTTEVVEVEEQPVVEEPAKKGSK